MKQLSLVLIMLSFLHISFGQTIVSEVIKVDSTLKKATLFSNGLAWFAYQFKSSNDVIQMKDLESGKIIGKGIFEYVNQNSKSMPRHILITLTVKDGKYKYDIELEIVYEAQIQMEASCFNCGKTNATVIYSNGVLQITDIVGGRGVYHYDNENVNWAEKGNYKKWKASVDAELPELRKKLEAEIKTHDGQQQDADKQKIKPFIESLKLEMVKVSADF